MPIFPADDFFRLFSSSFSSRIEGWGSVAGVAMNHLT